MKFTTQEIDGSRLILSTYKGYEKKGLTAMVQENAAPKIIQYIGGKATKYVDDVENVLREGFIKESPSRKRFMPELITNRL